MKLNSVHVRSLAINASNISIETIDGDDHYVIRGVVPIVDDVVMNGGLYPAAEINKSYQTLEGKPMPMGHPKFGTDYVSAENPRAVNQFHVGAWQENVRKDGERVVMDMKVNKRFAEATDKGKRLIERLDAMVNGDDVEPIHVSTGLLLQREANTGKSKGKKHTWIARNMSFDHTAILLDEPGAGTPGDGIGIFVNADGEKFDIEQVNLNESDPPDPQDPALKQFLNHFMAFFSANTKHVKEEINPMKELITNALKAKGKEVEGKTEAELLDAYNQMNAEAAQPPTETQEQKAAREKKEADEKAAKDKANNNEQAPAWFTPFAEKLNSIETGLTANSDKEKSEKRAAVKAKFGMTDVAVNALDGEPLNELFAQCTTSIGLNSSFRQANSSQTFSEMPE
ncbi:DUF2213 domain-containing protein [Serratia fonticola]|uniref:DUF2213 domain-containing protein n=1 Tax=Serratia fonticola TaxID=47917 RepID=UPI003B00A919